MLDLETVNVAFTNLRRQKLRSYLTLLGMVIGIAAIIALSALGAGLNDSISQMFEQLGLDVVYVEPGGEGFSSSITARTLEESDLSIIESIPGVEVAMGFYETAGTAEIQGKQASAFLIGYDPDQTEYLEDTGYLTLSRGRLLESSDLYAVMIGESFAKNAFPDKELQLRQKIKIDDMEFKIIGILNDSDVAFSGLGFINMFWITKDAARTLFDAEDPMEIMVKVTDESLVNEVADKIEDRLERAHDEKDFTVYTSESLMEVLGAIIGVVQLVVVGLASISVLVGGIGIMNTMLMAVLERTREIGAMKAIGATNSTVLGIFLIEAALLGLIGGIIGIIIGYGIAFGVGAAAGALGFPLPIIPNPTLIILGISFSITVGVISGVMPARRAAKMDPVEALRYE